MYFAHLSCTVNYEANENILWTRKEKNNTVLINLVHPTFSPWSCGISEGSVHWLPSLNKSFYPQSQKRSWEFLHRKTEVTFFAQCPWKIGLLLCPLSRNACMTFKQISICQTYAPNCKPGNIWIHIWDLRYSKFQHQAWASINSENI